MPPLLLFRTTARPPLLVRFVVQSPMVSLSLPMRYGLSLSQPLHGLLDVEPGVRPPLLADLVLAQGAVDLLDADELLDPHDHAGELGADGVEDDLGAAVEAEGVEDAARALGQADGRAVEGDAEEGHCERSSSLVGVRGGALSLPRLVRFARLFGGVSLRSGREIVR